MKALASALLAFQAEPLHLAKDATNPHFRNKYISLDALVTTVLPALNKHGLVLTQAPTFVSGEHGDTVPALTTRVIHAESGELLEDTMLLRDAKADPQGQGSALTYARRYAILSFLGLVADEDDDGQAASLPAKREPTQKGVTPKAGEKPAFEAPEAARASEAANENEPASTASRRKLKALGAKLVGEGKVTQEHLDSAMGAKFRGLKFHEAIDVTEIPQAVVDDLLERLGRAEKNLPKAQQEVAA